VVNERRLSAAKPARIRRDVAGFGPVPTQRSVPTRQAEPPDDAPVVRVILVAAEDESDDEEDHQAADPDRSADWREW
jgi:hypothetical protein